MPGFNFQPFSKKQLQAMTWWMEKSPVRDREILIADGSVRSGKTVAMVNGFIDWSLDRFSGQNFILAGKSMGALTKNVLNPLKKMLVTKDLPFHHVRSTEEPRLEIGTNDYYLYGANHKSSKDTLTGLTAAGSFADQVALFPENFVSTMIDRCSIEDSRHWWNCNPQGPKHHLKVEYIDKAEEKRVFRLNFQLDDNLTLSEQIKDRYRRIHSGMWYQRNILGEWTRAEGVVYDSFNDDNVVSDLPDMKKFWIGVDYGTTNPTVFLIIGLGKDNKFYITDEYYYKGGDESNRAKTDKEYAEDFEDFLKKLSEKHDRPDFYLQPSYIWIDPSAASFIQQLWRERVTCPSFKAVKEANNDVLDGIRKISTLIGENKLLVAENCENTIDEFHSYSWDPKAQEKGEDKPMKQNDHAMDSCRYAFNGISRTKYYKQVI